MSNTTEPVERSEKEDRGFFGQPFALANLFGVEMWERFSFYGMQGILIYYLYYSVSDGGLGISQAAATSIVGAYGGTVYLSTILGAWVADRLLGSERTLFYSASLVMAGHIALSVLPGMWGVGVGLVMVAFGSGGLKANATSLVGDLYSEQDVRRDAGFSIFYMGINIGGLVGPLLTGAVQDAWGFHAGFALAAVGMALGLIQYTLGRKHLHGIGAEPGNPLPADKRALYIGIGIAAIVVVAVASVTGLITADNMSDVVVGLTIVASVGYFLLMLTSKKVTKVERSRVFAFIPMFIASAAFWSLFQQQFTTVPVISDKLLDRNLFGWDFPPTWVQSINPVFIIIFAVCSQRCGPNSVTVSRRRRSSSRSVPARWVWRSWRSSLSPGRTEQCTAPRPGRCASALHLRRTLPVPRRPFPCNQTRARAFSHSDGGVVLLVRCIGFFDGGNLGRLLRHRRQSPVLPDHRFLVDRNRSDSCSCLAVDQEADAGREVDGLTSPTTTEPTRIPLSLLPHAVPMAGFS